MTNDVLDVLDKDFHLYPYITAVIKKLGLIDKTYNLPQNIAAKLFDNHFERAALAELVENITYFLGIPFMARLSSVKVYKSKSSGGTDNIGSFNSGGNIEMRLYEHHSLEQVVALAMHECTHAYLAFRGIDYGENVIRNEIFTEIAAIYLGFGSYLKAGYGMFVYQTAVEDEKKIDLKSLSHRVGYITSAEATEVIDEFNKYKSAVKSGQQ